MQLPGDYAAPRGALLLMLGETQVAGCVALRPLADAADVAELRRLYVRPGQRRHGYGRALVAEALARARRAGYRALRLETLDAMHEACALYESLGFALVSAAEGMRVYEISLLAA